METKIDLRFSFSLVSPYELEHYGETSDEFNWLIAELESLTDAYIPPCINSDSIVSFKVEVRDNVDKENISKEEIDDTNDKLEKFLQYIRNQRKQIFVDIKLDDTRIDYVKPIRGLMEALRDKVSVEIDTQDVIDIAKTDRSKFKLDGIPFALGLIIDEVKQRIADLCLVSNLSVPGAFHWIDGTLWLNGQLLTRLNTTNNFLHDCYFDIRKFGWPIIAKLPLKPCLDWYYNIDGILDGVGKGPIGRALAALSYIVISENQLNIDSFLVYSLIGLEAIYGSDSTSVLSQLRDKSQVLLGNAEQKARQKKLISSMYDFRSRFIHGDVDFPLAHTGFDGIEEFEKFITQTDDRATYATAMLVASLQELCKRNIKNIKFKWDIDLLD